MNFESRLVFFFLVSLFACGGTARNSQTSSAMKSQLTLSRLVDDPPIVGDRVLGLSISPDAKWLMFLKGSEADSEVLDLWGVPLESSEGESENEPRLLVAATDLLGDKEEELSDAELMARERKRMRLSGLVSYAPCGIDAHDVIFTLGGDLFHARPGQKKPKVERLTRDGGAKLDARCSPNGTYASFIRDGNVFVLKIANKKVTQITKGATATKSFGVSEFIAQEEMSRYDGHFWSGNERYLAYTEVDTKKVSLKIRPQIHADKTEMIEQRYPAAGEANAEVFLWVRDLKNGKSQKLSLPKQDGYLARVHWFHGNLYVQWQTRDQRTLRLFRAKAPRFALEKIHEETDDAWVELHHDLRVLSDGSVIWAL